jgi:hypothetical protein
MYHNQTHHTEVDNISYVEQVLINEEYPERVLSKVSDPVERDILHGLLLIKKKIGDRSVREYLEEKRKRSYKLLFKTKG